MSTPATALDALESRSDASAPAPALPEMTIEHKANILLIQRQTLSIQNTIHQLQKQLDQAPQALNNLLAQVCKDLNVDPDHVHFDLDKLQMVAKAK